VFFDERTIAILCSEKRLNLFPPSHNVTLVVIFLKRKKSPLFAVKVKLKALQKSKKLRKGTERK
jgi:hypothetical protein